MDSPPSATKKASGTKRPRASSDADGAAADDSEENLLITVPRTLPEGWKPPLEFVAKPSGVAAGVSGGLFHELHTAAAGDLTAEDLDGREPVYGGGTKASHPFPAELVPRPWRPAEPAERLPLDKTLWTQREKPVRAGRASKTNGEIMVRVRRATLHLLLEAPFLMRAGAQKPLDACAPIRVVVVRDTRYGAAPLDDVHNVTRSSYGLERARELLPPTPMPKRKKPPPKSRDEILEGEGEDPYQWKLDPDFAPPRLLDRQQSVMILADAHRAEEFQNGTERGKALAFWRWDKVAGAPRPRLPAVLAQAEADGGSLSILKAAFKKKERLDFKDAREAAARVFNRKSPPRALEVLGLDGPVGFSEQILGYLYGGAPGGDDPRIFDLHFSWRLVPQKKRPAVADSMNPMDSQNLAWV